MNDEKDVWPPPPAYELPPLVKPDGSQQRHRMGMASLIIAVLALSLGVTAVSLVPTNFAKRLPYGFLGNCDLLDFGLLIAGVACGICGRRSIPGKVGLSLSTGGLCLMIALLITDLVSNHVI